MDQLTQTLTVMPNTVPQWLDYIQTLHHREIELSLDRVAEVYRRLYPSGVDFKVINIAGTNGKGSTAELLSSIYSAAGYRVGKFTSPHISRFNERFNVDRCDVDNRQLLLAFARVEAARGATTLTYFEFGTLMAIVLFASASVDVAVMEVGLGGRLDAVNILDPDLAIVTSISIDHTAWLGDTIEKIAAEKIAIARSDCPCVLGLTNPPASIATYCRQLGISPLQYGVDFHAETGQPAGNWTWRSAARTIKSLPLPFGQCGHQLTNAAVAVQSVLSLQAVLPVADSEIAAGISGAAVQARCQMVAEAPAVVLDVAHNVDSVAGLLKFVRGLEIKGRVYAVCGMLRDKQISETLSQLTDTVDEWHFATINNPRGATAAQVEEVLQDYLLAQSTGHFNSPAKAKLLACRYDSVADAFQTARARLQADDCLIVFGSFFVVSDIIDLI